MKVYDNGFTIHVIDSTDDYVALMKEIFSFDLLSSFLSRFANYKILFNGMNGGIVRGSYC